MKTSTLPGNFSFHRPVSHLFVRRNPLRFLIAFMFFCSLSAAQAQLTVVPDPLCSNQCCGPGQCTCTLGVLATGGVPPYSYQVFSGSTLIDTNACVSGLCPGNYVFIVRDAMGATVLLQLSASGQCCHLECPNDTVFCFTVPDSLIKLSKPVYQGNGSFPNGGDCFYDSIWNDAPLVFPVGTTVVTWFVHNLTGQIDTCQQNVTRNPPSVYAIKFGTSPPVIGGVINICNGQSITFVDSSTGTSGLLWNFGNGFYSSNPVHTEPGWHYPPGTYYDTLTVYDDCGNPHDTAFTVVVDSSSGPDITCISTVCPGDTVTYHTNANCTVYNWTVTGGVFFPVPSSGSDSVTVIWGPGPHGTISLSVSGCTPPSTCPVATIKTVDIVPATLPVNGDTVVCAGATTEHCIECIPGNTHSWELMPGIAGTVENANTCCVTIHWNPAFTGIATLQVIYNNPLTGSGCNLPETCSHDPGCGGTGTITIRVVPIFGISGPQKVCPDVVSAPFSGMNLTANIAEPLTSWKVITPVPSVLNFANTGLLNSYTWNNGPGIYQVTAYAPPGVYCNDSATVTVKVLDMPVPNPVIGPDTVCAGTLVYYTITPNLSGVIYNWIVSGGTISGPSNGSSVAVTWSAGGGTIYAYQVLNSSPGCISGSTPVKTVVTWPAFSLPVISSSAMVACVKSTITYSIPGPLISNGTYTWSVVPATAGNIVSANGTDSIMINWTSAAITPIFVKLKISRCYEDSVLYPVNLFPSPGVPDISFSPLNPCIFSPVNFSTTHPGPAWNWSFGDAGTSSLQNPVHSYNIPGNFNLQLVVTNPAGCKDTAYTNLHVDSVPVLPVILGNTSVCLNSNASYSFSEPLFPGASYDWSLSAPQLGNVVSSGINSVLIHWSTPGTDTVTLHVQSHCLDTVLKYVVTVHALPVAGISVPSPACEGAALTFNGSGGVVYSWSFSGGSPSGASVASPSVTYSLAGNYPVSLTVTDANGCMNTANTSVTINPLPIAHITGPSAICAFPAVVTFSAVDAAGYSFAWSPSGSTPSISPTVTAPTTYYVVVTNAFGCSRTSNSITVNAGNCGTTSGTCTSTDTIDFSHSPPVCLTKTFTDLGPATLLGWDFGDGGTAGAVSPVTHTYPIPGLYLVTEYGVANGIDANGMPCVDTIEKYHIVTIPFETRFEFSFQCSGGGVMQTVLNNTSLYLGMAGSYNWSWYDSTTSTLLSTNAFPSPVTLSVGTHLVALYVYDPVTGATCLVTHSINVPAPISAAFTISSPVCQGSPVIFTDTSTPLANETYRL
ncbi:MAG: PKD domain-containing protein, partial [Bacteroidia bacterium]|nr:PKD domain-containing protein [Bacteroidia bacterium]